MNENENTTIDDDTAVAITISHEVISEPQELNVVISAVKGGENTVSVTVDNDNIPLAMSLLSSETEIDPSNLQGCDISYFGDTQTFIVEVPEGISSTTHNLETRVDASAIANIPPFIAEDMQIIKEVMEGNASNEIIPGVDADSLSPEDLADIAESKKDLEEMLVKLQAIQETFGEETPEDMDAMDEQLDSEMESMSAYMDEMFNMAEINEILAGDPRNIFKKEVIAKLENVIFKFRELLRKEKKRYMKSLNRNSLPKALKETMLLQMNNQLKPIVEDIANLHKLLSEIKKTKEVIKDAVRKIKKK